MRSVLKKLRQKFQLFLKKPEPIIAISDEPSSRHRDTYQDARVHVKLHIERDPQAQARELPDILFC